MQHNGAVSESDTFTDHIILLKIPINGAKKNAYFEKIR